MNKMKTAIDAVNELKADLNNTFDHESGDTLVYWERDASDYLCGTPSMKFTDVDVVCTIEEFNQCIDDMSRHAGDDLYERYVRAKKSKLTPNPFDIEFEPIEEVKTEYTQEMADAGELPSVGMECLMRGYGYKEDVLTWFKREVLGHYKGKAIAASCSEVNTVQLYTAFKPLTPPVVLEDGKAYQFKYKGDEYIGICYTSEKHGSTHVMFESPVDNAKTNSKYCTNIQLLEVK